MYFNNRRLSRRRAIPLRGLVRRISLAGDLPDRYGAAVKREVVEQPHRLEICVGNAGPVEFQGVVIGRQHPASASDRNIAAEEAGFLEYLRELAIDRYGHGFNV